MVTILVLGASGVAGRAGLPGMVRAGHEVLAHARSERSADAVAALGATPVRGDAEDPAQLARWLRRCEAIVDLRVSIPPPSRAALPWAWREYAHLRDQACGQLVDAALGSGVSRVVRDTVTFVYADAGDAWIDEECPVDAPGALGANLAAERHLERFTAAGGIGVALRFGAFYGPDDQFSRHVVRAARAGRALLAGDPRGYTSAIHTDDVGTALLTALHAPAGIYNVVDDEPLRRRELMDLLATAAGRTSLRPYPAWAVRLSSAPARSLLRSQRVSAATFKALGWRPTVPSRRIGWPKAFT